MSEKDSNALLALLAGVAIGAGLGILFAPDSGRKTREKLKNGVDELGDELQEQLKSLSQKVQTAVGDRTQQIEHAIDGLAEQAGAESEAVIEKLEARLAQLKARIHQGRGTP